MQLIPEISDQFLKSTKSYLKFCGKVKSVSVSKDHRQFLIQIESILKRNQNRFHLFDEILNKL